MDIQEQILSYKERLNIIKKVNESNKNSKIKYESSLEMAREQEKELKAKIVAAGLDPDELTTYIAEGKKKVEKSLNKLEDILEGKEKYVRETVDSSIDIPSDIATRKEILTGENLDFNDAVDSNDDMKSMCTKQKDELDIDLEEEF